MATPIYHAPTAPDTPAHGNKKPGFLKRHLMHSRRSSASIPHGSVQQTPPPSSHSYKQDLQVPKDSKNVSEESKDILDDTNDTNELTQTNTNNSVTFSEDTPRQESRSSAVKFAPGLDVPPPGGRHRRTSSTGTRRGSIFFRIQGNYLEGVDAGVGSKARRLSLAIPDELHVEECPLADHFSILSRAGKKDIGEGGAAVVRLMQSKTAGHSKDKLFAVKEFREWEPDEELEREYERKIKSEYAISKSCQNPNIVETFRLCHSDKKWFHVMEYCDLGDLNDLINKGYFSRDDRNCMFKQLLRGVEYLHARGIAHRDIKSENLLLTKGGCLKIADFGTAEVFSGTHPGVKGCRRQSIINEDDPIRLCAPGLVGSRPYMAPEIIKHEEQYDPRAVDVWSSAIVYLTLCLGGTPWECASIDVKNYNIFCTTWDAWLERYPDGIIKEGRLLPQFASTRQFQMLDDLGTKYLVMGMLHPDPSKRWSAKDALESKTVTEYPCCQQQGYSDDIKTRQRKALHNHVPPKSAKGSKGFLKPK